MAFVMADPDRTRPNDRLQSHAYRNILWMCRVVLGQSRPLAEQVLNGAMSIGKAFKEVHPPPLRRPETREDGPPETGSTIPVRPKAKPTLPVLKFMQMPIDEVDPAELKEFQQIFDRVTALRRRVSRISRRRRRCTGAAHAGGVAALGTSSPPPRHRVTSDKRSSGK
jgi:hypothetical protein